MRKQLWLPTFLFLLPLFAVSPRALAADIVPELDETYVVDGGNIRDFHVPDWWDEQLVDLRVSVRGADGGKRYNGDLNILYASGGGGAQIDATLIVGNQPGFIRPGSRLRAIAGVQGGSVRGALRSEGAGGGGGSALFVQQPGETDWTLIIAAGAGGGGYGYWDSNHDGGNASAQNCDNTKQAYGSIHSWKFEAGGGGGSRFRGQCGVNDWNGCFGDLATSEGSDGGQGEVSGGWGYGGGGGISEEGGAAGGGGGGYCGGSAGDKPTGSPPSGANYPGEGGGSYLGNLFRTEHVSRHDGTATGNSVENGKVSFTATPTSNVTLTVRVDGGWNDANVTFGSNTCSSSCSYAVPPFVPITLRANSSESEFVGWSGGGCSGNPCTITPTGDTSVRARFNTPW